ncbi:MAG: hypothetical protein KDA91_06145 [Planctomycetaceae bacterium]|nr:hypothetical protein [Planctomycetaceae bacterium]
MQTTGNPDGIDFAISGYSHSYKLDQRIVGWIHFRDTGEAPAEKPFESVVSAEFSHNARKRAG